MVNELLKDCIAVLKLLLWIFGSGKEVWFGSYVLVLKFHYFHHVEIDAGKEKLAAYIFCLKLRRSFDRLSKDRAVIKDWHGNVLTLMAV